MVPLHEVGAQGIGHHAGQVSFTESRYGLVVTPPLEGLAPGFHGFHLYQIASCAPQKKSKKWISGGAAGGHYDPAATNHHSSSWGDGHIGDLPSLYVDADGTSTRAVLAPRLQLSDLRGRTVMVHAGGDNHSDHPSALGGGGAHVACGVIN